MTTGAPAPRKTRLTRQQVDEMRAAQVRMAEKRIARGYELTPTFWSKLAVAVAVLFFVILRMLLRLRETLP